MKFVGPIIIVEDIQRSRHFYESVLKQKVTLDFGVNVTFEGNLAIHLKAHFEERANLKGHHQIVFGSNSLDLNFETEDIESLYERLKTVHVEFIHEIEEQPWGQRVMRFYDPDRHLVTAGEAMDGVVIRLYNEGLALEEIVSKTAMPRDFIEKALSREVSQ
ncbi:MAG: VOC family protein [Clostridia bacterium]|nr:VOC family protein [Clostridia bacterium]